MTLAETTVSNAIRYSMRKFCFANLIIAGPICAGKKSLAQLIAEYSDIYSVESNVTIFYQDDYFKEYDKLDDNSFGKKEIDTKNAFYAKKFVQDVRKFYENGSVSVKKFNRNAWFNNSLVNQENVSKQPACILETKKKRRTNIFVGPHAIDLLTRNNCEGNTRETIEQFSDGYVVPYQIPEAICIYVNTDEHTCMKRRQSTFFEVFQDLKVEKEYSYYISSQIEREIAFQKDMADIVINCK